MAAYHLMILLGTLHHTSSNVNSAAIITHVTLKHLLLALASIVSSKEKSDNIIEFACVRARSIGLIRIRRTPPVFSDETFDWAHPYPDESSELAHPAHPKKFTDEFGSRSRKVWYFTTPWFG